jgi:hypothetical protein
MAASISRCAGGRHRRISPLCPNENAPFGYTSPLQTASLFLAVVASLDIFVVEVFIEESFAMFANPLGTWLPLALIFAATYLTGVIVARTRRPARLGAFTTNDQKKGAGTNDAPHREKNTR